jgi:hypothetical protein
MWTSFHHQPEAQHPKSSAFHKLAGRLPHLSAQTRQRYARAKFFFLTKGAASHLGKSLMLHTPHKEARA